MIRCHRRPAHRYRAVLSFALGLGALTAPLLGQALRPDPRYQIEVIKDVMIPMRDGVRLSAYLYRPVGVNDPLATVLIRSPYNKSNFRGSIAPAEFFAGQGFAVVSQDVRGQFGSEGNYRVEYPDADDGYDTIDWIVKQPWSNGKVGTYGCSYHGEVQYLLSARRHPAHRAMIPQGAGGAAGSAGGYYSNFAAYEGGAFTLSSMFGFFGIAGHKTRDSLGTMIGVNNLPRIDFAAALRSLPLVGMARRAGLPESDFDDFVSHPPADRYWTEVGYLTDRDRFDTPALHVNSWLDLASEQTLYLFNLMRRNAVSARARDNQLVIMSPTTHCASEGATEHTRVGDRDVGDARYPYYTLFRDWFDHWLRGIDNGVTRQPKVHYFVIGKNEWRTADRWPVTEMREVPYYLASTRGALTSAGDGRLERRIPAAGRDSFVYDPANPLPSRGGTICCTGNPADQAGIYQQTDLESRPDLLVYTTPALKRGVTIAGTVKAVLFVSSNAKDTDFTAKLIDVDDAGRSWNVLNGIKRARYREGYLKPVWMRPGEVYRVEVSLKATGYYFPPGHRIRLWVSSSDFPGYDRNLNTGGNNYDETSWVTATNTIHHGGRWPSRLVLPVVPN
jgi:putative CocE/NonD family hydrolase